MMKVMQACILACLLIRLSGCLETKPNPQDLAATEAALTAAAAASPTITPSETPRPTASLTPTSTPSPVPSSTQTPFLSDTPTSTVTPGALIFKDNFSKEDPSVWTNCTVCKWVDNKLLIGPYTLDAESNLPHTVLCETCGTHTYYRIAVDAALSAGDTHLSYGLVLVSSEDELVLLGIDGSQNCIVARYDAAIRNWQLLNADPNQVWNSLLKVGKRINHLEVLVKPSTKTPGNAEYSVNLNGSPSFVIYDRPATASQAGLWVDDRNIQVFFSNFEYEVLNP
jgi:hypothetical protein